MNNFTASTSQRIILFLVATLTIVIASGCTRHDPLAEKKAEAKLICTFINDAFPDNEAAFAIARKNSRNELTNNFCLWQVGFKLPDKDTKIPYPKPISATLKEKIKKALEEKNHTDSKNEDHHKTEHSM